MQETWVRSLGWEDSLEKGTATHFSILAWRIPMDRGVWTVALQSMGLQRVRHDWATKQSTHSTYELLVHSRSPQVVYPNMGLQLMEKYVEFAASYGAISQ